MTSTRRTTRSRRRSLLETATSSTSPSSNTAAASAFGVSWTYSTATTSSPPSTAAPSPWNATREVARAIVARGHEVCGHGYRWEEYHSADEDYERDSIRKTVQSLERTTGVRPTGWFTRYGPSVNTRRLVAEEGGFVYDSMALNDDLPYYVAVNERPWLVIPYSFENNDARFWRGGLVSIGDFYEYLKESFDCLYEEGAARPKMMSIGLHCRITGTPARSRAVARFLEYATGFDGVWFARRDQIASHWLQNHPAP